MRRWRTPHRPLGNYLLLATCTDMVRGTRFPAIWAEIMNAAIAIGSDRNLKN